MYPKFKKFEDFFKKSAYWKEWKNVDIYGGLETDFITREMRKFGHKKIKVLDVACGHGRLLYLLSKEFKNLELYGIDINKNAVKIAKKTVPTARIGIGSVYKLPFKDKYFDVVVIAASFMHFENPSKALEEITRVCRNLVMFDVTTKTNISQFLRGIGIMSRSDVPENKYTIGEIEKILPKSFSWKINGYSFLSHKLITKKIYSYYKHVDLFMPTVILNKMGHSLILYGKRKVN